MRRRIPHGRVWRSAVSLAAAVTVATATVACGGRPVPAPMPGVQEIRSVPNLPARQVATNLLLYVPPDAPPGEKLPTVLYLHGGSQRGSDLRKLESYGLSRLLARGLDLPFIVIAPQLPEGETWSDADFLVSLLDELSGKHPVDPDRIYVTGMSMGGSGWSSAIVTSCPWKRACSARWPGSAPTHRSPPRLPRTMLRRTGR